MNVPQNGRALDVGCGYGGLSLVLAGLRPDIQITGVDVEASALESAAKIAEQNGLANVKFERGDGHQLKYDDDQFDVVMCQTVLTHVRDAETVVHELARVLKRDGIFMAAEYTDSGAATAYNNVDFPDRDEAWYREFYRISQITRKGKKALGRGDDEVGNRVPLLATNSGLDVFDMRLNDRALHMIPPYKHDKQKAYAELMKQALAPDTSGSWLKNLIFEANPKLGGCCANTCLHGYTFNDGALGLGLISALEHVFRQLGLDRATWSRRRRCRPACAGKRSARPWRPRPSMSS